MCVHYSLQMNSDPLFFITDVLLPPLLLSFGIIGCLLLLFILTCTRLRQESSIYIYLCGLASADLLFLTCAVPRLVRSVDLLPLWVTFSRPMVLAGWIGSGLGPVARQAALWLMGLTVAGRCAAGRAPGSSLARLLVFVVFLFCVLLNFTRFLDSQVVELTNHCFGPSTRLWTVNATRLGLNAIYRELRPMVVCFFGHVIPLTLTLIFVLMLVCQRFRRLGGRKFVLATPRSRKDQDLFVDAFVLAVSASLVVLEAPSVTLSVLEACFEDSATPSFLYYFRHVARCLSLLRCSLGIIFMILINYDFRKNCRRTCCCCCPTADDEFFEHVTCCSCCRNSENDDVMYKSDAKNRKIGKSEIVVCSTASRRSVIDNVYDDVIAMKREFPHKADEDKGLWI